ncbi:uncharacterized protein N7477_009845 [Penicillium maclennaniae]|uniref:uncharacterized protein n=1 Tax=Penicillium maclennaniae TaxID=1343394 RepID=UPI00254038DA|nr:uncharacterized protein N7477_009845 [Penicillium maclennaniae]KAJ5662229.1 hypothetical protein N7477_009845 [Penicillium maclennaniae]
MSGFQKPAAGAIIDFASTQSLHDAGSYSTYVQSPYVNTPLVPSPMADQASQVSDCVPYIPNTEYASSYEDAQSPMMVARARQLPEIVSYAPQRGCAGTRIVVQVQSPFDLHSSTYGALYLVFGSKKRECLPHFLGFEENTFQYAISADAPPFNSTGSASYAVPIQVEMETSTDCAPTTLQVGVYTYEHASQPSPPADSRKRKFTSHSDSPAPARAKRATGPVIKAEPHESYSYRDPRAPSYSPYLQNIPTMSGYITPFHAASSPRTGPNHYSGVSATPPTVIRAPSPLTPVWSPSVLSVSHDGRQGLTVTHGIPQHRGPSPARIGHAPTLIRTSTLQQGSGLGSHQHFNPYASIYPTKQERDSQRRLVQFTRNQIGSTIHADFKPVAPEDRPQNSICISCISWEGKDECYVTSVDTIYLLEALVGVRFTVEEKNRIRRNLEGFRPLTVSKAKADSEEFFKVIMGFPAPKPRNIEKDVKSASYSSTAGTLPTTITNYAGHGTGSDSGTETHAPSPQSVSDHGAAHNYTTAISAPVYSTNSDQCASMTAPPDVRSVMPSVSQPYTSVGTYSYPAICQPHHVHAMVAPSHRVGWNMHGLGAPAPATAVAASGCYSYIDPGYPLHDGAIGP